MLTKRALMRAAWLAGVAGLAAVPAQAVNIPEGGAVTPDSVFVIHFQVREGCEGAPMDALEIAVPASVQNPMPEAIDGWDVTVTPAEAGTGDSTMVSWTGGPLEEGSFKEFGLWARFPDEPGAVLTFPAVQRCGTTEVIWDGHGGRDACPDGRADRSDLPGGPRGASCLGRRDGHRGGRARASSWATWTLRTSGRGSVMPRRRSRRSTTQIEDLADPHRRARAPDRSGIGLDESFRPANRRGRRHGGPFSGPEREAGWRALRDPNPTHDASS